MARGRRSLATILVVDDDPQIIALVTIALKRAGHEVVSARDGQQALECARRRRPQLILLDLLMPGMSGQEVLAQMREDAELAQIPVVLATGGVDSVPDLHVAGILPKPYKLEELYQIVQRLVRDD